MIVAILLTGTRILRSKKPRGVRAGTRIYRNWTNPGTGVSLTQFANAARRWRFQTAAAPGANWLGSAIPQTRADNFVGGDGARRQNSIEERRRRCLRRAILGSKPTAFRSAGRKINDGDSFKLVLPQWPELVTLPEIGELLARRIVDYRQQFGPFKSVEDLRRVRGIGPKTMEHLRPYLEPIPSTTVAEK